MNNARHPSESNLHVEARINDLYATSAEIRAGRRPRSACDRLGAWTRARLAVGRRLISIGGVVAGQHA